MHICQARGHEIDTYRRKPNDEVGQLHLLGVINDRGGKIRASRQGAPG